MSLPKKFRAYITGPLSEKNKPYMFYQGDQYLGSFLRRANLQQFASSGHDSYGSVAIMQQIGVVDRKGKDVYEADIVRVYDSYRHCICDEWEECEGEGDPEHAGHDVHEHEKATDCEKFLCTQEVKWNDTCGFICEEDTGDYCPLLGADEIELDVIGNIHENPELKPV